MKLEILVIKNFYFFVETGKAIGLPDEFLTMPSRYSGKIEDDQDQNSDTEKIHNNIDVAKSSGGGVLQVRFTKYSCFLTL